MEKQIKKIFAILNYPRTFLVYLCVISSKQKNLIVKDVERWCHIDNTNMSLFKALNWYLTSKKEFRNLVLHRLKGPSYSIKTLSHYVISRMMWKPLESLYIYTKDIGGGLYIQHGFATIISAKRIGENCRIYQQVTVGYKGDESPVLEDNVSITCGAKVLGNVTMHSGSIAAAGAVVVKDVPKNAVVAGVPAKIISYKDENNIDFQG